ncbi:MAG TPA: AAA family ATPase [Chitinophagales bacterium]|nr:AAA family ATPase [Chitinophagales bacterium]
MPNELKGLDAKQLISSIGSKEIRDMLLRFEYVHPVFLFYSLYQTIPFRHIFQSVDKSELYLELKKEYDMQKCCLGFSEMFTLFHNRTEITNGVFLLDDNLILSFLFAESHLSSGVMLLYSDQTPPASLEKLKTLIPRFIDEKREEKKKLHILSVEPYSNGFELADFDISKTEIDLEKNYNEDLPAVAELILQRLNTREDKGIVILHGKAGTGKTTFIRHLIGVTTKRKIFIPPNMADRIANPEFVPFLKDYPNSILIIEDAESILMKRNGSESSAVSNLLNLSDGLLSDCFNIQVICTFNTDLTAIDKALLRKGRLIAKYEFKELTIEKSKDLLQLLGHEVDVKEEMTLAEIYNFHEREFDLSRKRIGFTV